MDRNTLLNSTRNAFMATFRRLIADAAHSSIGLLYNKAERSASVMSQRHFMDARTVLATREAELVEHIVLQLEALLKRSFKTAYDTFRPSFFKDGKNAPLALMDITAFEDDLRIDIITSRFRSESEEQLRDLNIRIAILFERNDIAERENPFRPYLLTRAITLGVEQIKPEAELFVILTDQLGEELLRTVASLYEDINQHLSECGVAAQLQFKSQRMPEDLTNPVGYEDKMNEQQVPFQMPPRQSFAPEQNRTRAQPQSQTRQPETRVGRIEQLINIVRSRGKPGDGAMFGSTGSADGTGNGQALGGQGGTGGFIGQGGQNGAGGFNGSGGSGGTGNFNGQGGPGGAGGFNGQSGQGGHGGSGGFDSQGDQGGAGGYGGEGGQGGYHNQGGPGSFGEGPGGDFGSMTGTGGLSDGGAGVSDGLFGQAGSTMSGWLGGAQQVGETLRRVFFGGGTRSAENGSGDDGAGLGSVMMDADAPWQPGSSNLISISPRLNSALRAPVPLSADMVGADGEVRNLIIERRDALNTMAADQHEKMTIDIVAMLFEFILKDHQVPAEVRAQLGRLQFSVLKMALMDSALLTRKSHPARLLVNRIGSISVGLQQIDPTGEKISAEICRIVEELLAHDAENPELFSKMLDQLDSFIATELLASNRKVEQAVQVVAQAESRSQRLNTESIRLEKMLDGILITPYLRRFLLDTWSHVIERVERNPTADSTRFRLLVPNLLWSILPKSHRDDRSMLLQIIPIIVPILREGMSLVAWLPEHQQELLNWLVDAHTLVMRTPISDSQSLTLVDIQRHFHAFVYPDAEPLQAPRQIVDVNRVFLDEAIKELEKELQQANVLHDLDQDSDLLPEDALPDDVVPESTSTPSSSDHTESVNADRAPAGETGFNVEDDILDRLRSGVVVEINLSGSPTKGRLNWISPNSSNLILTVNGQEAPSIISVRMFRRMLKNSRARFVEVAPLFERAVQSLLESADLVDLAQPV